MDFAWTPEQEKRCREMAHVVRTEIDGEAARRGYEKPLQPEELRACAQHGLLGLSVPSEYGGAGFDLTTTARLFETFGYECRDMGLVFACGAHLFACAMPIAEYGPEELKHRLLPAVCSGERICANAITEDEAGSDVYSLRMRATRNGDDYVLKGEKSYVSNAPHANLFVTYASTAPGDGFLGISAFVVKRGAPGLVIDEPFEKMGLHSIHGSRVRFEDCRVPASQRIGDEGQGGLIFNASMAWERTGLIAAFLGLAERQIGHAVQHARERKQFGRAIGKNQAISHRIVDMKVRVEAARLLLYRACWRLDRGEEAALDVALAKLAVSEAAVACGLGALHVFGGSGFACAHGVERGLRDAMASTIASGTSEMQREIIARELGL